MFTVPSGGSGSKAVLHFSCLPLCCAGKFIHSVAAAATAVDILGCLQNPSFSAFQRELKTNSFPGIPQAFWASLGLLRHSTLWAERLLASQSFQHDNSPDHVVINQSLLNICSFYRFRSSRAAVLNLWGSIFWRSNNPFTGSHIRHPAHQMFTL